MAKPNFDNMDFKHGLLVGNMAKLVKKILMPFWNALETWVSLELT